MINAQPVRLGRQTLCALAAAASLGIAIAGGCISRPQNPAATQPATVLDLATTQPTYWLAQPAVATVKGRDFDTVWEACKSSIRDTALPLDRVDYRAGVISSAPVVSKQWFELWRHDSGTPYNVLSNSLATLRRTLRFEVARNDDGTFTIVPKVLVERETILERHVTDVSQYRFAFSGPSTHVPTREAVALDPDVYPDVPIKYWTPVGRDTEMEKQVAVRLQKSLDRKMAQTAQAAAPAAPTIPTNPPGKPFENDGIVSALGPNRTLYVNVGANDKVVAGMTFEVYDARATLPTLETFAQDNPQSRGWVEVVTVENGRSLCKILKAASTPPAPGDQIFNFVFQRGRPNHFALSGDFRADRETISGLIWRWNGVIDTTIVSDTNYVILGQPPRDAAARKFYDAAKSQAEQLKIPTLGEDKFDLLIRYYDPAKR